MKQRAAPWLCLVYQEGRHYHHRQHYRQFFCHGCDGARMAALDFHGIEGPVLNIALGTPTAHAFFNCGRCQYGTDYSDFSDPLVF
ncbi:MAG: hypothetical protein DWH82_08170 [Planctomycetota bacterium]|nr:MAG: hypothetical protein DWH82_08170 [Planctomycetota bacterium]